MSDYVPLSVPSLKGKEWEYVKECLDKEWVSSAGEYVNLFEKKIAEYTGAKYGVACVNGTSALQVSLRMAGVQSGDEVIVPTLTFIAPVNAITYNGASPVFMDADDYYNSRSKESRIGAWASNQSSQLKNRKELENNFNVYKRKFEGKIVPRPSHWSGYKVEPNLIEFWQEMPFRLHDRVEFIKSEKRWIGRRLYP